MSSSSIFVLGISAFYHDSSAAIIKDGVIIAAAQEERFTRIKHDERFPTHAIRFCLDECGVKLNQLNAVVFYDKPLLKFERLLETYYAFAPRGFSSFVKSIPIWLKDKLFLKRLIRQELKQVESFDAKKLNLLFTEHHLSHAASAYYPSPFEEAAILTIDGVGEWATASICVGKGENISMLKELHFPNSLGLLYSAFTYYLGFKVNSGEYKIMGLAPYGNSTSKHVADLVAIIKEKLIDIKEDGSLMLHQEYFDYAVGLTMTKNKKWQKLFGFPRREEESKLEQHHCDLAMAIQLVTEEIVIKMAREAKRITGLNNLCLAGGVALNCVANGKLVSEKIFNNVYIQPASGDAGGSIGAALAAYHLYFEKPKLKQIKFDAMFGSYLGPEFSDKEIKKMANQFGAIFNFCENEQQLLERVSEELANGSVVGWFQGKMEFGPRALGNRSILADPRNGDMQKKLNLKIKNREGFRPFAPSVLAEDADLFFKITHPSPYMLVVNELHSHHRNTLPENYQELAMNDKLYFNRSAFPAITHVDFSARVQTVHQETNPKFWSLINTFKNLTGVGMLVNTSFNRRGEPIVCTPTDAYECFMQTEMDILVIGNYLFEKKNQPHSRVNKIFSQKLILD